MDSQIIRSKAFAVIRSYSDHHWMTEMGESIRRIGEIRSVIADITREIK